MLRFQQTKEIHVGQMNEWTTLSKVYSVNFLTSFSTLCHPVKRHTHLCHGFHNALSTPIHLSDSFSFFSDEYLTQWMIEPLKHNTLLKIKLVSNSNQTAISPLKWFISINVEMIQYFTKDQGWEPKSKNQIYRNRFMYQNFVFHSFLSY